jgi:hypothetical protein
VKFSVAKKASVLILMLCKMLLAKSPTLFALAFK